MNTATSAPKTDNENAVGKGYRELAGLFHSPDDLETAISDITSAGWDRSALSLLGQHNVLIPEEVEGSTVELADDPDSARQPPVSETDIRQGRTMLVGMAGLAAAFVAGGATVMTGGGTLAAVVGAAAAGGGAGALVEALGLQVGSAREKFLAEQLEQGGILLWIKIDTAAGEQKARAILENCGASHIHLHNANSGD